MDTTAALFSQAELCDAAGIDNETVNNWIKRGLLDTADVGGRKMPGRRLFSLLAIYKARLMQETIKHLMIPASHSAEMADRAISAFIKAEKLNRITDDQQPSATVAYVLREGDQWTVELRSGRIQIDTRMEQLPLAILPISQLFIAVHQECLEFMRSGGS